MYLEKIEINGFKSFANKTILEFTPDTTCIVGPNGSGKSNIVDAIRWVTGEQSPKNLRGKKSQDIIFSGSDAKSRSNMAEVSLYLNNDDKRIDLEYSPIIITRRVYRDGESEYLINKSKAKLQDIVLILAKANFGQKSYGIIGQGVTDYILTCSPRDRKLFFDEAAGVKHHQIKRDQSINKLDRSHENLTQGEATLKEIEPRLRLLQRQVDKLNKRKEIEKELTSLQQEYYSFVWNQIENERGRYQKIYNDQELIVKNFEIEIQDLQKKLSTLAQEENQKDNFNSLKEKFDALNQTKNNLYKELTIIKGKLSLEYIKVGKQNISWLENKKEELKQALNDLNLKINKNESQQEVLDINLRKENLSLNSLGQEIEVLKNNLATLENELNSSTSSSEKNKSYIQIAVDTILEQKDKIPGIYGTITQLGKVKKAHEVALAVTAGSRLNALVVENEQTAINCIQFLKNNHLTSLTFLPLNKLDVYPIKDSSREIANEHGAVDLALDLIEFENRFSKAFELVFGSTVIVEDSESARAIGINRERMVTLDGDIFEKSGMIQGGYRSKNFFTWDQKTGSTIDKRMVLKQISDLKNELSLKLTSYQKYQEAIEQIKIDLKVFAGRDEELKTNLQKNELEIKNISREIEEGQISPENQDQHFKDLKSQASKIETEIESLEKQILVIQKELDSFNLNQDNKKRQIFELQENMQRLQSQLDIKNRDLNEASIYLAKLETRKDSLVREIEDEFAKEFTPNPNQEEVNIEDTWKKIKNLKSALEMIGNIDTDTITEYETTKERFDFISQQVIDLQETIKSLDKLVTDLDKIIKQEFNKAFEKINQHFDQYFKILFDGGKAELRLIQNLVDVNALDEIEAEGQVEIVDEKSQKIIEGLEIIAMPPGKKIKNMEALSGGEKTMTALALVCAVIAYNPPPFVILDEADAALDEANTQKFSEIIDKLSPKTQFITITHNRVTMEKASTLYGVTMNNQAISKIISISLADAKKTAAR
ncbi:MAG: AAA family ATPase [Patescibacteria group bacterium]